MSFDSVIQVLGWVAGVTAIASIFYRTLVAFALTRWGTSTKGNVLQSKERNGDGGVEYVVSYEFAALHSRKNSICSGKQIALYKFQANDTVAVQYLPAYPHISRIVERKI